MINKDGGGIIFRLYGGTAAMRGSPSPPLGKTLTIACEQGKGKERGREKREPIGMTRDFDFQMPVIIWEASTTTTANFE